MIKNRVDVLDVLGDKLIVKFDKKTMCSCCRMEAVCSKPQATMIISRGNFSLNSGDKVEVGVEGVRVVLASLIVFLLPVFIFI
ncbi:MAG: SoxR reducing system RseC family protein, partial [Candidatus Omnitrophota bacterium]